MSKTLTALCLSSFMLLTGCAGYAFMPLGSPFGSLYTGTQSTTQLSSNDLGAKRGEACAMSILGIVTIGDSTVSTAAKAGGITKISNVDTEDTNIIGVYAKHCTYAVGN